MKTDMSHLGLVSIDRKAQTPMYPIKPKKVLIVGFALVLGLLAGLGLATVRYFTTRRQKAL